MRRILLLVLLCVAAASVHADGSNPPAAAPAATAAPDGARRATLPRLVLLIVVDQLGRDRLDAEMPGGLGRLAREGWVFENAELAHAASETCPGHVAIAAGRHPGPVGVGANYFVDRDARRVKYCLEDDPVTAGVLGSPVPRGRSPRNMRAETLGDWLKAAHPGARSFSVSAKDRSAIALGGQRPDGVYWLERSGSVGFTTSRYYAAGLPDWVMRFNGANPARDGFLAALPDHWIHFADTHGAPGRPDDYRHETPDYSRRSAHPLRDEDLATFAQQVYVSPFLDDVTLDFATRLVREEQLGRGAQPDLLALSLAATDTVGHAYGPESHESADGLRRLDAALGRFLENLEAELGAGSLLVALGSDHGVLPIPEWLQEQGRSRCTAPDARLSLDALRAGLRRHLWFELGGWFPWPRPWLLHSSNQLTVDRVRARERGVAVAEVVRVAEAWLEVQPGVVEAWTHEEIRTGESELALRHRRSFDPERSGDLIVQSQVDCLLSRYESGTSHGSPYAYDADVPLLFWGAGVEAGRDTRPAANVDVAPTLAELLGLRPPPETDGRSLLE